MPKTIITCAVTGAIHTPSMSPYLPVTPDEIVEAALGAAEAAGSDASAPDRFLPERLRFARLLLTDFDFGCAMA